MSTTPVAPTSGTNTANIVNLVALLLPIVIQYGPALVSEVSALIHGSSGLSPAALQAAIAKSLTDAEAKSNQVLNS